jgi:hypothetical protein
MTAFKPNVHAVIENGLMTTSAFCGKLTHHTSASQTSSTAPFYIEKSSI